MMFPFSWGRIFAKHLEGEIAYLRAELRFQRDENQRLQNAIVSLKFGGTVSTLAPAMPREAPPITGVPEETDEFASMGSFDQEPASRGAV